MTMTDVTAMARGATAVNYGVFNTSGSSPTMTDVTADASPFNVQGAASYGVWSEAGSQPTISQSKLSGGTAALRQDGSSLPPAKVALSQLAGPVQVTNGGSLQCFNNYNRDLTAVNCP
jgi:hypothetical protein